MPRFSNFSICIIFVFGITVLWNFLKLSPRTDFEWPEHWKAILKHSESLQLILLDGFALKCFYQSGKEEEKERYSACNELYSNIDNRFGTKIHGFDKFWKLLNKIVVEPSNGQITFHELLKPDTIILRYTYPANIEKFIFFTIPSTANKIKNYHLLRGGNTLASTIAIPKVPITFAKINGYQMLMPENLNTYLPYYDAHKFVSCNTEISSNASNSEMDDFNSTTSTVIPHGAVEKLYDIFEIFINNGQIPFMAFGTLLGWYRECGIISYTTDFDFHIFASEYNPAIEKIFYNHPSFPIHHRIGKREYSLEYTFFLHHGIHGYSPIAVDIFYLYPYNETHEWSSFITDFSTYTRGKSFLPKITKLCTTDFYGYLFFVPCNYIEVIKANYGNNWMRCNPNATYFEEGNSNALDGHWNSISFDETSNKNNNEKKNDDIVHYF